MRASRLRLTARAQAFVILAAGFACLLVYAFPGFMSPDSHAQLLDARSHNYTDWHPPAMAAVWTVLDALVAGPALMLLLQGSLFLAGLYRILRHVLSERAAALTACGILLVPPVLAPMAVIWKDSQMAAFVIMAVSLLLDPRRWTQVLGVVLIAIATAYRDNAAAATLPLLLLLFRWPAWSGRWKTFALASMVWLATVVGAVGTNKLLTKVQLHAWYNSLAPSDVIGVLEQSRPYSDAELLEILDGTPLVVKADIQQHCRTYYNPTSWWYYMTGPWRVFDWPANEDQRAAIRRAWKRMVVSNPVAYFSHRLRVFRLVIAIGDEPVMDPAWHAHVDLAKLGQDDPFREATGVQRTIGDALTWLATHSPLFRPYMYLVLALLFVPLAWRHRDVLALLLSGVSYELALFFIAPSPDYRYSHWMVTCTVLGAVMLVIRRSKRSDPHADAAAGEPAKGMISQPL